MSEEWKVGEHGMVRKLLANFEDAVGRTVESVTEEFIPYNDCLVIRFTDKTAIVLREGYCEYNSHCWARSPETFNDSGTEDERARVYLGIMPVELAERHERERDAQYAAKRMLEERAQYENLKKKFEHS